ncbi:biotin--[acetyl-CoA-carboxylase] ligase [Candidatus Omnitrophota bacterium]
MRKQGYTSGEEISHRLKISRQALWKHIQDLKDAGYDIAAVPHLGYQLVSAPDRLFPHEVSRHLDTKVIAKEIHYFDKLASTMDLATELGLEGASEGTLVLAETQTRGRGRLGRNWLSPKHKGIYLSLILRPEVAPAQASIFTLLSAVSICEAIKEVLGLDTQIKWPNDILLANKKAGGILTELDAEIDQIRFVVIGIGLNVNNERDTLVAGATSLKQHSKEMVSRIELLQAILRRIEKNYLVFKKQASRPIIEKWREHNATLGKRVKVVSHNKHIEGQAVDIDADGCLLVRKDSGLTQKVAAGDVSH